MPSLQQVQDVLEKVLGAAPLPFHIAFWRGRTRDELVATQVLGQPLIIVGKPEASPLVQALQGKASGPFRAYFGPARAQDGDLAVIEKWIREGCPEMRATPGAATVSLTAAATAGDDQHTAFWRAMDVFFHPAHASPTIRPHVLRVHGSLENWAVTKISGTDPAEWPNHLAKPGMAESFEQIRYHQRRLLQEYYAGKQADILDSLWRFGGSLLPTDPKHPLSLMHHRMNSVVDWFNWVPYLEVTLGAPDVQAIDLALARAWQIGIVADGLLRTDDERPAELRMPISDFTATDPNLRSKVDAKYMAMDAPTMIGEMLRRAQESAHIWLA